MILIMRIILAVAIPLAVLFSAACASSAPELPSDPSPATVADKLTGATDDER
jgi:hypothetical protein